jgi:transcriptional regulator with XRE-family HTH domain
MTGDHLRQLREDRGLTREQLATELGDCTASTINKWERGINPVPQWVEDRMLRQVRTIWPLEDLHELLDLARAEKTDLGTLITEGAKLVLAQRRGLQPPAGAIETQTQTSAGKVRLFTPGAQAAEDESDYGPALTLQQILATQDLDALIKVSKLHPGTLRRYADGRFPLIEDQFDLEQLLTHGRFTAAQQERLRRLTKGAETNATAETARA